MAGRVAYLGNVVTQGLILDLDAAKIGSYPGTGSTWYDLSNRVNDSQIISASFTTGSSVDKALFFSTGSMYVAVPTNSLSPINDTFLWNPSGSIGSSEITIEIWFNSSQSLVPSTYVFSKPWNGSGEYNYYIRFNNTSSIQMHVRLGNLVASNATVPLLDNTWKQLVFWINPTNAGYYINGGQYSGSFTHGVSGSLPPNGNGRQALTILSLYPYPGGANPTFSLTGSLSNVKFYTRQLTSNEVQQNFNALRGRYGI